MKKLIFTLAVLALMLAPVSTMADGTDPMPLCRHVDSHGNPCVLPPSVK